MQKNKFLKNRINRNNSKLKPGQVLMLGFFTLIIFGALLLNTKFASVDGGKVGFVNAVFTATSAVCVTGLSVVDTGTYWTIFGKAVILFLIQIGGLGFMTMATSIAIIMGKKISLRNRLIMQEALNQFSISGVIGLTRYIILMTFAVEGLGALLLSIKFIPEYGFLKGLGYSIFHSISAFCNAGFDIIGNGRGFTPYSSDILINFTLMSLIIIGGIGFYVLLDVATCKLHYKKFSLHSKLVVSTSAILLSVGFILFFIFEFNNPDTFGNMSLIDKIVNAMFQSVTTRTAGFNMVDISALKMESKFITMLLMIVGGSPGSTAGGLKTTTVAVLFLMVISLMKNRDDVEFANRRIPKQVIRRAMTIAFIGIGIVTFVIIALCITEPNLSFEQIMFEAMSAFGTVGLSLGVTPQLSTVGKIIIAIAMFFGRLGPLTVILGLSIRNRKKVLIRYPEGKILVG